MEVIYNIRSRQEAGRDGFAAFRDTIASNWGGVIEQCSTPQPRDEICALNRVDTSAVTDVAVTPAGNPFNVT